MKISKLLFGAGLIFTSHLLMAQNISGVVNAYTPVNNISGCFNTILKVGTTQGFAPNDKVLLIQMQGATIDQSNSPTFGDVIGSNSAGLYELNRIKSVSNGQIELLNKTLGSYDIAGKVQLIKVPEYTDATVSNVLTCQEWNGTTGGVLVIDVSGTLTLNSNINVTGKGFRGGIVEDANAAPYGEVGYFYSPDPIVSGQKGEGITIIPLDKSYGRGKAANGGGAGNSHNGGGGGGGNAGAGGFGGLEYYNTPSGSPTPGTNGVGGLNLYAQNSQRLLLGGGGGAGHTNDNHGTSGGNGGGIVILIANNLISNGKQIVANGQNVLAGGTERNDGQGGGGAGGTIFLHASQITGILDCQLAGGFGGDCLFFVQSQIIGPGGGGGGGKLLANLNFSNLTINVNGGQNGVANQNNANGATPGATGTIITQAILISSNEAAQIEITQNIPLCPGESISLGGQNYTAPATVNLTLAGQGNACDTLATYQLTLKPQESFTQNIPLCSGESINLGGQTYTAPATVNLTLAGQGDECDTLATYILRLLPQVSFTQNLALCPGESIVLGGQTYTAPATINLTLAGQGDECDTLATYVLNLLQQPTVSRTIQFCPGETVTLGGVNYTQPTTVILELPALTGCDTIATYTLESLTPAPSNVSIACPNHISLATLPGSGPVVVNYAMPVAATDCPCPGLEMQLSAGLPSGSLFPVTNTTVCWVATDSCGQSASCCFVVTVREEEPCDVKVSGCLKYELLTITADAEKNRTYRVRVTNNCTNRLIYTAIQVPDGMTAMYPADNATYEAPNSGREYLVRNPNFSPMYSVRFKSVSDSIANGESEIFRYKLPAQADVTFINIVSRLEPQIFLEAHLNTFYCPIGVTPAGERPTQERLEEYAIQTPDLLVFPNPVSGTLYLDVAHWDGQWLNLRMINANGQTVLTRRTLADNELLTWNLPEQIVSGLYFLEIQLPNGEKVVEKVGVAR